MNEFYFERVNLDELPEWQDVLRILENWRESLPYVVVSLKQSIPSFSIVYSDRPLLHIQPIAFQPRRLRDELKPVAVYNPVIGTRLDREIWNGMGQRSRTGLLLHELFRHLELGLGVGAFNDDFDAKLRFLVALMVLGQPGDIDGERIGDLFKDGLEELFGHGSLNGVSIMSIPVIEQAFQIYSARQAWAVIEAVARPLYKESVLTELMRSSEDKRFKRAYLQEFQSLSLYVQDNWQSTNAIDLLMLIEPRADLRSQGIDPDRILPYEGVRSEAKVHELMVDFCRKRPGSCRNVKFGH